MLLSIIVPCYNEEAALPCFLKEISKISNDMTHRYGCSFELIFVDDGSCDSTLDILKDAAKADEKICFISFSRNFGKEAAMYAGLRQATGD